MTETGPSAAYRKLRDEADARRPSAGRTVIMVGTATCGRAAGALDVLKTFKEEIARAGVTCDVIEVGCLGHCYAEPLAVISKPGFPAICYGYLNPVVAERLVQEFVIGDNPCPENVVAALETNDVLPSFDDFPRGQVERKRLLENCGLIDPGDIYSAMAAGGYSGLARALEMTPEEIIEEVTAAGLRGMGGAGYPAGKKWLACRQQQDDIKYVIANGDEGDPGAFMDRTLMESDPHRIIEGLIIAGYALGAGQGYIYVRAEYPLAVVGLETALKQARDSGLLGDRILGTDFQFDITIFKGSGAFVCGEATAMTASIEGRVGLPRVRPPHMAERGLFGRPTVVNNVKTLAYVPQIIARGADWFREMGAAHNPGTAVIALAGKVVNTGLVEVPLGTTLRDIIFTAGSGIPKGKEFKAVQVGGPSGGCLPEATLDMPVDYDSLRQAGAMMGSGGMVVLDEDDCMVEMARYFLEFTQRESCGKCTFCRLGTKQMLALLEDITEGRGTLEHLDRLGELAADTGAGSLCGLGQTAPNPVLTTLKYFRDEYEEHIRQRRCPALMCRELIAYYILPEKCERSCDACVGSCTVEAIKPDEKRVRVIDQEKCVKCGSCLPACPPQYSAIVKVSPPEIVQSFHPHPTSPIKGEE